MTLCGVGVKVPVPTTGSGVDGHVDYMAKMKWCESMGWVLNVDFGTGWSESEAGYGNTKWYFSKTQYRDWFLIRWL